MLNIQSCEDLFRDDTSSCCYFSKKKKKKNWKIGVSMMPHSSVLDEIYNGEKGIAVNTIPNFLFH